MQPEMNRGCGAFIGIRVSIDPILEVMVDMICVDGEKFLPHEFVVWGINPPIFPAHESKQCWKVLLSQGKLATGLTSGAAVGRNDGLLGWRCSWRC